MSTAIDWAILVQQPDGTTKRLHYASDPTLAGVIAVAALGSGGTTAHALEIVWENTPESDSVLLEATIIVPKADRVVELGDVITLYTEGRTDEAGLWNPRWRGRVDSMSNPNSDSGEPFFFSAVGLSETLERVLTPNKEYSIGARPSDDEIEPFATTEIGTVVSQIIADCDLKFGITAGTPGTAGAFTTAVINPGGSDLATALQALINLTTESGGNDIAFWVTPAGVLNWNSASTANLAVNAAADGAKVEWVDIDATEIVTAVKWLIADGEVEFRYDNWHYPISLRTPDSLSYESALASPTFPEKQVIELSPDTQTDAFQPFETPNPTIGVGILDTSYVGTTEDTPADISRMSDGNPNSYIVVGPDPGGFLSTIIIDLDELDAVEDLVAISVGVRPAGGFDAVVEARVTAPAEVSTFAVIFGTRYANGPTALLFPETSGELRERFIVAGDRARNVGAGLSPAAQNVYLSFTYENDTQRYVVTDFRAYKINKTALDAGALDLYREPIINQVRVTLYEQQALPATLDLTTPTASPTGLVVEKIRQKIQNEDAQESGYTFTVIAGEDQTLRYKKDSASTTKEIRRAQQRAIRASYGKKTR